MATSEVIQIVFQTFRSIVLLSALLYLAYKIGGAVDLFKDRFTPGWKEETWLERWKNGRRKNKQSGTEEQEEGESSEVQQGETDKEHKPEECGFSETSPGQA